MRLHTELKSKDVDEVPEAERQLETKLKATAKEGLDPRSALGQKCMASLSDEDRAKYNSFKRFADKAFFRKEWAASQLEVMHRKRENKKGWKEVDATMGVYLPLATICQKEGYAVDPKGAIEATNKYAMACVRMQGRWIAENALTGRLDYLDLKRSKREEFTKSWHLFETQTERFESEIEQEQRHIKKKNQAFTTGQASSSTQPTIEAPKNKAQQEENEGEKEEENEKKDGDLIENNPHKHDNSKRKKQAKQQDDSDKQEKPKVTTIFPQAHIKRQAAGTGSRWSSNKQRKKSAFGVEA